MDNRGGAATVAVGGWIGEAPWWLISAGLHVVLLLGAALVYVERAMAVEEGLVVISMSPPPRAMVNTIEREPEGFVRKGIPQDDDRNVPQPVTDEPVIFFPEAKIGDHLESEDGEDYHQMKGDSKAFLSYLPGQGDGFRGRQPGNGKGVYDALGVGGGAGGPGRYGDPFGGRENLRISFGKTGDTKSEIDAVLAALKWLARHQGADGGWHAEGFSSECVGAACSGQGAADYDVGETGLAVMAFLGAGFTSYTKDEFADPANPARTLKFGEVVKKGIQWLMAQQDAEGCIGPRSSKFMYNHAIAALALSEAYGMTSMGTLREPAQKAIGFIVAAQKPGQGWRYGFQSGDNDTSVTGWAVMALKSAELSGIAFPKSAYDGALAWFRYATGSGGYYQVGYNAPGTGTVFVPGQNENFVGHPSMSAVSVMSRIFIQKDKREPALGAVNLIMADLPEWTPLKIDFYYWYYASLALYQYDGPKGPVWKRWEAPLTKALVPTQKTRRDGCQDGSWDPSVERWGFEGGRVYAVAINALTLEVCYRYASVFGSAGRQ